MSAFTTACLIDLPAFRIGCAQDERLATGCTAIVAPTGAVCGVDVRGGGPATRETDLLKPENMVQQVHAVVLAGGSAFGLEASCGVMDALAQRGIGFEICGAHVPIVVGACLFDLPFGESPADGAVAHPDKAMGTAATEAALSGATAQLRGNVGAGCGATVGKLLGERAAMKSGQGVAVLRAGDLVVGAIVAVNALGNVRDPQGGWLAGCRDESGSIVDPLDALAQLATTSASSGVCENTTIAAVMTNAALTKAQATKTASTAHDAYARAIKPVHTLNDGDTVFCLASGEVAANPDLVSIMATEVLELAVYDAVRSAGAACGLPAANDLR